MVKDGTDRLSEM